MRLKFYLVIQSMIDILSFSSKFAFRLMSQDLIDS